MYQSRPGLGDHAEIIFGVQESFQALADDWVIIDKDNSGGLRQVISDRHGVTDSQSPTTGILVNESGVRVVMRIQVLSVVIAATLKIVAAARVLTQQRVRR